MPAQLELALGAKASEAAPWRTAQREPCAEEFGDDSAGDEQLVACDGAEARAGQAPGAIGRRMSAGGRADHSIGRAALCGWRSAGVRQPEACVVESAPQ